MQAAEVRTPAHPQRQVPGAAGSSADGGSGGAARMPCHGRHCCPGRVRCHLQLHIAGGAAGPKRMQQWRSGVVAVAKLSLCKYE
jgi:hypothetical protein